MKQTYYICSHCDKIKMNEKYIQKVNVCPKCGNNTRMTIVIDDEQEGAELKK